MAARLHLRVPAARLATPPPRLPQNNKNNDVANPGGADLRMALLPQRMKAAGYRTAMSGKWHVGARSSSTPEHLPPAAITFLI